MSDSAERSTAWTVTPDQYLKDHQPRFEAGFQLSSRYLTVRDGTRLAVDVHLPLGLPQGEALPTLVIFTPYYRRFEVKEAGSPPVEASPNTCQYRDFFVPRGYAVVVVDVRGTGASFGSRDGFRSPAERLDYYDVVDWVAGQPWCDGNIGSIGISYVGAAACFLATTGHPAVKAVVPTFAVWDTYADHFYSGGLLLSGVLKGYDAMRGALDLDQRAELKKYAYFADPRLLGPAPVDEDADGRLREAALAEHLANVDMNDFIRALEFRDSALSYDPDYTSASISPYHYAQGIDPAVAYYCVSGWMDGGGYGNGAVKRFLSIKNANKHLILGPWDHGARTNISPFRQAMVPEFKLLAECLRFFDHYLKGLDTGLDKESRVHYFTLAEEAWKAAETWPVREAEALTWYLGPQGGLGPEAPGETEAFDEYRVDYGCGTGEATRYERLSARVVEEYYGDWSGRDARMLTYTTPPLIEDLEITGHPLVSLHLSSTERDGAVFAYLEDLAADGTCRYVTEGVFRVLHRRTSQAPWNQREVGPYHSYSRADAELLSPGEPAEVSFALYPTSWLFRQGHRIRLALASADRDHFSLVPAGRIPVLRYYRSRRQPSRMVLPTVRR